MLMFLLAVAGAASSAPIFPSFIFFENSTNTTAGLEQMRKDQIALVSHYQLAVAGWGENTGIVPAGGGPPAISACHHREAQLQNALAAIKAVSPSTLTAGYAGQFEFVVAFYDEQRKIIENPAFSGMFMHDDDGKLLLGPPACSEQFNLSSQVPDFSWLLMILA